MANEVKGYKVFNPNWTCRDYQYTVGETAEMEGEIKVCERGFHFCVSPADCFNYYTFDPCNKVAEVVARGNVKTEGNKSVTDKLEIVREVSWEEVLQLVNVGSGCSGLRNSGDCNSGDCNSGNFNSGDCNSGNFNSGNFNSGNRNSGNFNSGNFNSGNRNSGDCNSGNRNSGNFNSGDCNSGDCNSGDFNSGDFNKTDCSNGCFCTKEPKIYLFNKASDMTLRQWWNHPARYIMNRLPEKCWLEWTESEYMTEAEKAEHPEHETTGGFLRVKTATETAQHWWDNLSEADRTTVCSLPNFDPDVFKAITGIKVKVKK